MLFLQRATLCIIILSRHAKIISRLRSRTCSSTCPKPGTSPFPRRQTIRVTAGLLQNPAVAGFALPEIPTVPVVTLAMVDRDVGGAVLHNAVPNAKARQNTILEINGSPYQTLKDSALRANGNLRSRVKMLQLLLHQPLHRLHSNRTPTIGLGKSLPLSPMNPRAGLVIVGRL
jgi:hypothetical protein